MKLVVSGSTDESLRNEIVRLVGATEVAVLNARAMRFTGIDTSQACRAAVAHVCDAAKVDHAFLESSARWSNIRLLAMDMDSTLITIECIDEMADFAGKKREVAAITEATMRGEIKDFSESLRRRVALLAGVRVDVMERVYAERLRLSDGAPELLDAARKCRIFTLLVSGGFTYFTERIRDEHKLNETYANSLEIIDGRLTGRVMDPVFDAAGKSHRVAETMQRLDCRPNQAIVIGDGANDIPMMQRVSHSIAFHAKPAVTAVASCAIRFGSLQTALDYFN